MNPSNDPSNLEIASFHQVSGQENGERNVACTIVIHPDASKIGALFNNIITTGETLSLGRQVGLFRLRSGGEPFYLDDPFLSRQPICLKADRNGVFLSYSAPQDAVKIDSRSVESGSLLQWHRLDKGVFLVLHDRIGFWLWRTSYRRWPTDVGMNSQFVSQASLRLMNRLNQVDTDSRPIGLVGEWGSGKQFAAKALHRASPYSNGQFIAVNPRAEARLFREQSERPRDWITRLLQPESQTGLLAISRRGTLFLEDLAYLPRDYQFALVEQASLLSSDRRVIYGWDIVHGDQKMSWQEASAKMAHVITVPPLRDRRADIPVFFKDLAETRADPVVQGDNRPVLTVEFMGTVMHHHWPGNVSQLRAVIHSLGFSKRGSTRWMVRDETDRYLSDPSGIISTDWPSQNETI